MSKLSDSVYSKKLYNATTFKYPYLARDLRYLVEIETPDYYGEKRKTQVVALFDTGATGSVISKHFADELGLMPTDFAMSGGVSGKHETALYDIVLNLNSHLGGIKMRVSSGYFHSLDEDGPENSDIGFLIGMDIIGLGDFFTGRYLNSDGKECTMFTFRFPSALEPVDYLEEVREFNKRVEDQRIRIEAVAARRGNKKRKK